MLVIDRATVQFQSPGGPQVRAVDGISLEVPAGQFVVVIGTNGSGKSTLLGSIAGTVALASGAIRLAGHDITAWPQHARARLIGRVFQDPRRHGRQPDGAGKHGRRRLPRAERQPGLGDESGPA